jgi:hypothetical protein
MDSAERLRADLDAAMVGAGVGLLAANQLCRACVDYLHVDGAAISLMHDGGSRGTFGSSSELSRRLDEFQFTFGEGPCLDAVSQSKTVLTDDLSVATEQRWPAFAGAVLGAGVRAVFAAPISIAAMPVGAIDLFRHQPGGLTPARLAGLLHAAELAAQPLLDLMSQDMTGGLAYGTGWGELESLDRVEVYQATGMIMAQLDVPPAEALIRLRAHAFAYDQTASEVAWAVVGRQLKFARDDQTNDSG